MSSFNFRKTIWLFGLSVSHFIWLTSSLAVPLRYIPKLPGDVIIDGKLNEPWYRETQPIENFKIAGQPGVMAPATQAWMFWNEDKMVFAFHCADSQIIAKPPSWDDMAVAAQDRAEFYLGSGNEGDPFICFEIAPQGAALTYRARYYRYLNFAWNPESLRYAVSLTPQGYIVEAEIHNEDLREANISLHPGARFRAGLFRSEVQAAEQETEPVWITWIDASEPFPDFHIPRSLGEIVLEDKDHPAPSLGRFAYWEVGGDFVKLRPRGFGEPVYIKIDESSEGWKLLWTGRHEDNPWALLENADEFALISDECRMARLAKPPHATLDADSRLWYDRKSAEEILSFSRDILGEKLLSSPWIDPSAIAALLPPITNGYQILGSPLTGGKSPLVTRDGKISLAETVIFDPAAQENRLSGQVCHPGLLDGWMPMAHYEYTDTQPAYVYNAFVPVWERGNQPSVYIRLAEPGAAVSSPKDRFWVAQGPEIRTVDRHVFWGDFVQTVFHWRNFETSLSLPDIPDPGMMRVVKGCLALPHVVFTGEHPHYGARDYGADVHDTFPPAWIAVVETAFQYGEHDWVKKLVDYWFTYCVNDDGTIRYWQRDVHPAASASEYGMIYRLIEKLDRAYGNGWNIQHHFAKLEASVHYLHSLRRPVLPGGYRLIHLGAEADNAELRQAYFSNNLWAARGLESLSQLFERYHRPGTAAQLQHMAQDLMKQTRDALAALAVQTPYGLLPPIYPGYAPLPLTLSTGIQKPADIEENVWQDYLQNNEVSIPDGPRQQPPQNQRENTYANYRYYLEMLSSGGLPRGMADAIDNLRADRGGELLGMTRFAGHLDDWPAAEWASYLLTSDQLKKYWLLFHAHVSHHQDRQTLTAFEQVGIDGKYRASDCLPSQLLAPRMLAWAFAFEFPGDENLYLLRGIPPSWYQPGTQFGWADLPTSAGTIDLHVQCGAREVEIKVDCSRLHPDARPVIQVNAFPEFRKWTILEGTLCVEKMEGNRIYLLKNNKSSLHLRLAY